MNRAAIVVIAAISMLVGCLGKDDESGAAAFDVNVGAETDTTDASTELVPDIPSMKPPADDARYFDRERVYEVRITMASDDWDTLRQQTRTFLDILGGPDCLAQPVASPFTWFSADVVVDGMAQSNVGVRKKGFLGSLDDERPSLKVKLDEFVDGQNLDGLTRLTLNNARQDPSKVNQCISYDVYAKAGVPAPRCSYVHLFVNDVDMGLYVNVESIKKDFIRRHFEHDDGNLYEGALSDFRPGWLGTFERKTNKSDLDRSDLEAITAAAEAPDSELLSQLEPWIHLERFISMWAVDVLINHVDGYAQNTNNFYIYRDLDGRFTFIPWGADNTLIWNPEEPRPPAVMATGVLSRRLYRHPETQQLFIDRLLELLDKVWQEDVLLAEIDRQQALILPHVLAAEQDTVAEWLDIKRAFIQSQRERLLASITPVAPPWDVPLRQPPCLIEHGTINVSFDTTWGTLPVEDIFSTGTGAMAAVVDGAPWTVVATGSKAGSENLGEARIIMAGALDGRTTPGGALVIVVTVPQPVWLSGAPIPIGFGPSNGQMYRFYEGASEPEFIGFLLDGSLTLEAAGTSSGAPVKGTVSSPFFRFGS